MTTLPSSLSHPLSQRAAGYWHEAREPFASLMFVAPLLLVYEAGVLVWGPGRVRNGADAWLRYLLEGLGFGQYFLLPVLTVCILMAWHYTTRRPWRVSKRTLYGMTAESLVLAALLRLWSELQGMLLATLVVPLRYPAGEVGLPLALSERLGDTVGYLGAGIYEELLFRLILLSCVLGGLKLLRVPAPQHVLPAVVLTSLLFAGAHYVGVNGDELHWYSFLFRFVAGIFFAILFVGRGFGIAVGAHAGYDILVGMSLHGSC